MTETAEPQSGPLAVGTRLPKAATGIAGLDDILDGGLPVGRTTLLSGGPGTGKTVLAMEFIYRGAQAGQPGVFVSFEERTEDLAANAASMGMDLADLERTGRFKAVHAAVPHGAVRTGDFDIKGLLAILDGHTRQLGAKRLVLDAIDVLMRLFGDPDREREELYVLHDWIRDRGMTAILTVKAGPEGAQLYPFLDYMADCILFLDQRIERQVRTRRLIVLKYRGSRFLSNEHPYVLSAEGVVLMPVSSATLVERIAGEQVSSGHEGLDGLLGGGYFRGSCILLGGPTGAGKTTLGCLFTQAACRRGERVLYVSFEEAVDTLLGNMCSLGIDLRPAVAAGTLTVATRMPEAEGVEQHLLGLLRLMERSAPQHLVVDAISACRRMGSDAAAFDFCVRLLTACKQRGITVLYLNQATQPQDVTHVTGIGISSLVDTLIALPFQDDNQALRRRLLVLKSRGHRHSMRYHDFVLTGGGLAFVDEHDGSDAGRQGGGR